MAIGRLQAEYEEGSPWRPPDPNGIAHATLAYQKVWEGEHQDDGRHNHGLIPMEAATVDDTGTILQGSPGIAVSRIAAGRFEIDIAGSPMATTEWFAHVYPDWFSNAVVFGYESGQAGAVAKDEETVEVRFVNAAGAYVDVGFWVGCYGARG